jgi:hypothetical protein
MKFNMNYHLIYEDGSEKIIQQSHYTGIQFSMHTRLNKHTIWKKVYKTQARSSTRGDWNYESLYTSVFGSASASIQGTTDSQPVDLSSTRNSAITSQALRGLYPSALYTSTSNQTLTVTDVNQAARTISVRSTEPTRPQGVVAANQPRSIYSDELERRQAQRQDDLRKRDSEKRSPAKFWERAKKYF